MSDPLRLETLQLRAGSLRFGAEALGEGPLVLCLHGFPDHRSTFRHQLRSLAAAGFRAVAPSLRGYERGALAPDGDYQIARMAEDALAQIDQLSDAPVHVVGHDWGAVIAYGLARLAPQRVRSVVTMSIPHPLDLFAGLWRSPHQLLLSSYWLLFQPRRVAALVRAGDFRLIEALWRIWSPGFQCPPAHLARVKAAFAEPGVLEAALGYYRALRAPALPRGRDTRRLFFGRVEPPTLLLHGSRDGCMSAATHRRVTRRDRFAGAFERREIAGAGHFLHLEQPGEVDARIVAWLRRHSS